VSHKEEFLAYWLRDAFLPQKLIFKERLILQTPIILFSPASITSEKIYPWRRRWRA